jgi:hypothetical protein
MATRIRLRRGTTAQRAGTDNLYDAATQTSISIAAGTTARVVNDGTYWLVV